jgi:hypothetical protein
VIDALVKCGCWVDNQSFVGRGRPDLYCVYQGREFRIEVKANGAKLTGPEADYHRACPAPIFIVRNVEEALALVNRIRRGET